MTHVAHIEMSAETAKRAQRDSDLRVTTHRADGVTRCSKCPPTTCCPDCAQINKARAYAGLIRPHDDPRPHPNNCLIPTLSGPYQGSRTCQSHHRPGPVLTARVAQLGGGWRVGIATLEGEEIYRSAPMRSTTAAFAWADEHRQLIREGLEYEALLMAR